MFRRPVLISALWMSLSASGAAHAMEGAVTVVTGYPEELMGRFEAAFERAHPDVDLTFVWKQSRDGAAYLRGAGKAEADVYWTPSPATFRALADEGAFTPSPVDRAALPGRIGGQAISDPHGRFEAFEVAGYGIVWSPAAYAARGATPPTGWRSLADPKLKGALALPVPSQVGFAPALYDVMLQAEGWEGGWASLRRAAAGAVLIGSGGQTSQTVVGGQAAAAPTIDFFAETAVADGRPVKLTYPDRTAFSPAHVALSATAPHPQAARAFVDFVLSAEGQKLLFAPDVRRRPVRPAVYADAPAGVVNPFNFGDPAFVHDADKGRERAAVLTALFDRAITVRHDKLKALWAAVDAVAPERTDEAVAAASVFPVSEAEADAAAAVFRARRDDSESETRARALEKEWDARFDAQEQRASAVAIRGGATVEGARR